jgi:hypothetical protein
VDTAYHLSLNHPQDDTISGSSEVFRHDEFQLTQLGAGGDLNYKNVQARLMTQFGMYSTTTPRNDASPARGQWQLDNAYRYISEAYGGYHIDKWNGINIQAGIFMSYVGLWSYYQFDNWTYQPSYVSSNTPWFFNGVRVQIFPSDKLKIEPWLVNGWQAYGRFTNTLGGGGQILWRRRMALGPGQPVLRRTRWGILTDAVPQRHSVMVKYTTRRPQGRRLLDRRRGLRMGVSCHGGTPDALPASGLHALQPPLARQRPLRLHRGRGRDQQPWRYLVLVPPINGATAFRGRPTS